MRTRFSIYSSRETWKAKHAGVANDPRNLTPNPFPSGKGNWIVEKGVFAILRFTLGAGVTPAAEV